ncbi:MAG: type IV secretory system conjugative DNA transfer family protein [Lachnospiraceae bacterium]|nr:type IV secretory system conjugative DNA transfer family protein [Lachnospiraceae bacterium]
MLHDNDMIFAENQYYEMDSYKTKRNNNVLVVGTSGSGKTRNIVAPNLLQATGSYIVSDPKGNLHRKYKKYLENKGYVVKKVDFVHPEESIGYNPLAYVHSEQDVLKLARLLTDISSSMNDKFWDLATELLFSSVISFVWEGCRNDEKNLTSVQKLIAACQVQEDGANEVNVLDQIMENAREDNPDSFSVRQYDKFRIAASRTLKSILITVNSKIGVLDTRAIQKMLRSDMVNFASIGKRKTAVFVVVSDTERSMDILANLFFSQAINELCKFADERCSDRDNRLPVDVRFILDDFATNVTIAEFPRMISSIRSRGISAMLMIQSEGQLVNTYGHDAKTIIGNCDNYLYLGGNDINTAQEVARRCDVSLKKILNMPVGTCWIFRRGQEAINAKLFDLEKYEDIKNKIENKEQKEER